MTMRLISILLLAISIAVLAVLMVMRLPGSDYFSATCRAFMDYHGVAGNDGFNFKGDISFFFNDNKTGRYYISGSMNDNDGEYSISRLVTFKYQYKGGEEYIFSPVSVEKSVHDDISDKIYDRLKRMLPLTQNVSINMSRNENYLLFSNAVSPLFICVSL
ncbi:FidL-like protein [Pseudocitrobacter faecalis]|uniref:FidL-like protein n=1 Tax=Pseudocitrobacter faecalis TaxID=1398493 RepID=UPI0033164AB8